MPHRIFPSTLRLATPCRPGLVGRSREEVAERAGLCRHSIRKWETSTSDAVPGSALPQLLRTLTDEFAFRRILGIAARVLPIQIEHHWQDIAASTPPLPCADYLAVTKAQD
jgi:hypothetical protein